MRLPEIMAPVADWDMCRAAVHNGADAIYVGAPHFNARGRTHDLSTDELKTVIEYCHLYGVQVFIALNVLVFEKELDTVEDLLREILPLHPDALIIQDIGLAQLVRKLAPWQQVHASTQMTVSCAEAIALTEDLGISRYVLPRETSIPEMAKIRAATAKELEVFVHGALCVSYSGQCLTSESSGGRSANRGQCAQSCRLPYGLVVDGADRPLGDKRYLVSPQDLCGVGDVPRLMDAGIDCFKIEGRLKTPEYVAGAVQHYREARDQAAAGRKDDSATRARALGLTFARGRFNGWFDGVNHQKLVDARFARPSGVHIGRVIAVSGNDIELECEQQLAAGDGIACFDFKGEQESGGIVFGVTKLGPHRVRVRLGREFDCSKIRRDMEVYHNSSATLEKELRGSYQNKERRRKVPLRLRVCGRVGARLEVTAEDDLGHTVTAATSALLEPARKAPLTEESVGAELGALAGSPYCIAQLTFDLEGATFLHQRELKDLRRRIVESMNSARLYRKFGEMAAREVIAHWRDSSAPSADLKPLGVPELAVLIRDESQIEALSGARVSRVYLDYEYNKEYENALARVRQLGFRCGIATTRIMKPGELGHLKYIARLKPDLTLVRNLGALHFFRDSGIELVGDFSLNVTNSLSAAYFINKGLRSVTASYDLNGEQLLDLARSGAAAKLEVTVHQYMPAFHMEHCVFAAFLSNGTSYRDCGRPCEKHRVELRDPSGTLHPVKADAECRNTMFQGRPQSAARLVAALTECGVRSFRLEALFESAAELRAKIDAYASVVFDGRNFDEALGKLGIVERYGVTEGQLFNRAVYRDRKKELLSVIPSEITF